MPKETVTKADIDAFPNKDALEDAVDELVEQPEDTLNDPTDQDDSTEDDASETPETDPEDDDESEDTGALAEAAAEEEKEEEAPQYTEIEQEAIDNGWVHEDNFKGDKDNWVSAKRWMKEKRIFDELDALRKSDKKSKEAYSTMMELLKKRTEKENEDSFANLKEVKRNAILEGNVELVEEIDEKISKLYQEKESVDSIVTPIQQELAEETKSFIVRNKHWFNDTHEAEKNYAIEYEGLLDKNRKELSLKERFDLVEKEIERVFGIKQIGITKEVNASPAPKKYVATKLDNSPRMKDLPRNIQQMVYKFCDIHNKDPKSKTKMTPALYIKDMHAKGLLD